MREPVEPGFMKNPTPNDKIVIVDATAESVDLIFCPRFHGQNLIAGTRIDVTCVRCGYRICMSPNSQRFYAGGGKPICRVCVEEDPVLSEVVPE